MLHHVSVGVSDVSRAAAFYDRVLGALGYKRVMEFMPYAVAYGDKLPEFWVQLPQNRLPATVGNGVHIAFNAVSRAMIEDFHRAGLAAGGSDEGAPGPRPDYGPHYHGAFLRDLDGNKLEAVLIVSAADSGAAKKKRTKKVAKKTAKKARKAATKAAAPRGRSKAKRRRRR